MDSPAPTQRAEGATARSLDASEPPDPDPNGFQEDADKKQDEKKSKVQLPEGLTEQRLKEWAAKKKAAHAHWFGDNNGFNEKINDWWKAYDNKLLAGQQTPTAVPISNAIIETDTAKTYQAVMARARVVDAMSKQAQIDNENKQTINDLVNQELLWSESRTGEKLFATIKALKIEGTGIARARWRKRFVETIPDTSSVDPLSGERVPNSTVEEVKVFKETFGPDWESTALQNMIYDHRKNRIQESGYVCEKQFPSDEELLIMQDEGLIDNVEEILKQPASKEDMQKDLDEKRKRQLAPAGNGPVETTDSTDTRELDEWFAWVPYQKPQEDGSTKWQMTALHFIIVNDDALVLCEPNPWVDETGHGPGHPYISFHQCVIPRSFLGKSVHAPIMDTQVYINNLMSSSQRLVNKAARNPTFVSRGAGLDTLRLFTDELAVIPVQDTSQVKYNPIDGAQIKAVSDERAWAINIARETVAANEQAQGVPTTTLGNATATEAAIINANSGTRFQLIVDQFIYEFFAALGNLYYWMMRQWAMDDDLVVRESTIDGAPRNVTRADLQVDYFFVPITSAVVNDTRSMLQQEMQFAQQVQQLQATNPQAMVDSTGKMYRFDLFDFLVQEIMPKLNIRNGRTYMKEVPPEQMMAMLQGGQPQQGQPGAPIPQAGAAPNSLAGGHGLPRMAPKENHGVPTAPPRGPAPRLPVAPGPSFAPSQPFNA